MKTHAPRPDVERQIAELTAANELMTYALDHGWTKNQLDWACAQIIKSGQVPSPTTLAALARHHDNE